MSAALGAYYFFGWVTSRTIGTVIHILFAYRPVETWPTGTAVELGLRGEQPMPTAGAMEGAAAMLAIKP